MARVVVILILIAVPWLTVATAVIGACRVAALGDAVEQLDQTGLGIATQRDARPRPQALSSIPGPRRN